MLSATWLGASRIAAQIPNCAALELVEHEADQLGDAWATYIDSIPSKKRKATMEIVQRFMPGLVALGSTIAIFAPRVQAIHAGRTAPRPARRNPEADEPRTTTPPPPRFADDPIPPTSHAPPPPSNPDGLKPDRRSFVDDSTGDA